MSDIKSRVGVMSVYGVQEARDLFWGTFAGGKRCTAQRQSMWDLLFMGLNSTRRTRTWLASSSNGSSSSCSTSRAVRRARRLRVQALECHHDSSGAARGAARAPSTLVTHQNVRPPHRPIPSRGSPSGSRCHHRRMRFVASYLLLMYGAAAAGAVGIAAAAQAQAVYVSPSGDDSATGTSRAGRIMIEGAAVDAVWKSRSSCARLPASVLLRGGTSVPRRS